MSTRGSIIYHCGDGFLFHLYHEVHDESYHIEITDNSSSSVNMVIPKHMVGYFKSMISDKDES